MSLKLERKIDTLERTVEDLQVKLKEKEVEIRRLEVRNSLGKEHARLLQAEEKLARQTASITSLDQEVCSLKRERSSLVYEVGLLRGLVSINDAPDDHLATADAMARCSILESDVAILTEKLAAEGERKIQYEQEISAAKDQVETVRKTSFELIKKIESYEEEFEKTIKEREGLKRKLDSFFKERDEACETHKVMKDTILDLEQKLKNMQSQHNEAQKTAVDAQQEVLKANSQIIAQEAVIQSLKENIKNIEKEMNELKEQLAQNDQVKEHLRILTEHSEALVSELDLAHDAVEALEVERVSLQQKLKDIGGENEKLLSKLQSISIHSSQKHEAELKDALQDAKDQINTYKASLAACKQRFQHELEEIEQSRDALAVRCEALGHICAESEAEKGKLSNELEVSRERTKSLSRLLEASQSPNMFSSTQTSAQRGNFGSLSPQSSLGCGSTASRAASDRVSKLLTSTYLSPSGALPFQRDLMSSYMSPSPRRSAI